MMKKRRLQMIIIILVTICLYIVYIMNNIAFFKDKEFERAVRETLISSRVSMVDRREKALGGIIWKRDFERVQFVSINFREYKVKNIEDMFPDVNVSIE